MLILLNRYTVMCEMMELACLKIAGELRIDPRLVTGSWELEGDFIVPKFNVSYPKTPGVTVEQVQLVIGTVYRRLKKELTYRLTHLEGRRRDVEKGKVTGEGITEQSTTQEIPG